MKRRAWLWVAMAPSLLLPSTASASCFGPIPMDDAIAESAAAFVGTVSALENDRRWATVDVLETWKGGTRVTSEVVIKAGPKDPPGPGGVASSIDRRYCLGETYLFVVYGGQGSTFRDSNCSRTTRFDPRLARFRPAGLATSPAPEPSPSPTHPHARSDEDNDWETLLLVALVVTGTALLLVSIVLVRDRRGRGSGRPSSD